MCHDHCPNPVSGGDALTESEERVPLIRGHLPTYLARPSAEKAPAVLLLHDINGANEFYHDVARRLAIAGYLTALPDLFHRHPPLADDSREAKFARMQATEQAHSLNDIESALIWLRDHQSSTGSIATIGFCMGGTLALLSASRYPRLDATIAYYGFPFRERTPVAPSIPLDDDQTTTMDSPLLAFWGTGDTGVGMDNVAKYDAKLTSFNKPHDFVIYQDRPHGFLTFDESSPNFADASDSWTRTLAFLEQNLAADATE